MSTLADLERVGDEQPARAVVAAALAVAVAGGELSDDLAVVVTRKT